MTAAVAGAAFQQTKFRAIDSAMRFVAVQAQIDIEFLRGIELKDRLADRRMHQVAFCKQAGNDREKQPFASRAQMELAFGQKNLQPFEIFARRVLAEIVDETIRQEAAGAEQAADLLPAFVRSRGRRFQCRHARPHSSWRSARAFSGVRRAAPSAFADRKSGR